MNRDKGNQTLDPKKMGIKLIEMDAQQKVGLLGIKKMFVQLKQKKKAHQRCN